MDRRILIATLLRERGPTGVQTHIGVVKRHLLTRNFGVSVATPFLNPRPAVYPVFAIRRLVETFNREAGVWWYHYWHYVFLKFALRGILRTSGPVVVYAQCPLSARAALETRIDPANQRVVMAVHFNISLADEWATEGRISPGGQLYRNIKSLEHNVLPRLDGILYVSHFMRATIERNVPAARSVRSAVIPNFIATPDLAASPDSIADLITVGTLDHRKNQAYLLRVLAAATARGRRFTLSVAGDGRDRVTLEKLARTLHVERQVRFLGIRNDIGRLLQSHRAYVHAALMENLSITIVEAMANGLPIFAPPVGGTPEIFSHNVEGMYWSLDDPAAGAEELIDVLDDRPRYAAMRHAARLRFSREFSTEAVADRLTEFLYQS